MSRLGRHRFSKQTQRSLTGLLTAVVVVVLILQGAGLRPIFVLQRGMTNTGTAIGNFFTYIKTYDEFQQELSSLRVRVNKLAGETTRLTYLEQENNELKELLSFTQKNEASYTILPAHVLARSFDDQRSQFILDRGSEDGIEKGFAVVAQEGVLIGTVESVKAQFSTVRLLTDHRSRVATKIRSTETIGVSEGRQGSLLEFGFIPQHTNIQLDDLVLTSGLETHIPGGLVIGFITSITEDDTQPFKSATIEPIIDARLYQTVGVIRQEQML